MNSAEIVYIVEAPCIKDKSNSKISIFDARLKNYWELLGELRQKGAIEPISVAKYFGEFYGLIARDLAYLRSNGIHVNFFFVTPIGLLKENDFVIPYDKCFDEIGKRDLELIFESRGIRERLYDTLEDLYELYVLAMDRRLLTVLSLEDYIPINRPAIIISDSYGTTRENIYVVTRTNPFFRMASGKSVFIARVLNYISRALIELNNTYNGKLFMFKPKEILNLIFDAKILKRILKNRDARQLNLTRYFRG